MNETLKSILRPPYRLVTLPYRFARRVIQLRHIKKETDRLLHISSSTSQPKIFYFGITEHSNLGDLAQYYCIRKWINENYPSVDVHEFESTTVVDTHFNFIDRLSRILNPDDIIVFHPPPTPSTASISLPSCSYRHYSPHTTLRVFRVGGPFKFNYCD